MLSALRVRNHFCNMNKQKYVEVNNRQGKGIFLHFLHLYRSTWVLASPILSCLLTLSTILNKSMVLHIKVMNRCLEIIETYLTWLLSKTGSRLWAEYQTYAHSPPPNPKNNQPRQKTPAKISLYTFSLHPPKILHSN